MNRHMRATFSGILAGILLGLLVNTASAAPPLNGIPLKWLPRTTMAALGPISLTGPMATIHLRVEPFTDSRQQPELIGQNLEKKVPRPVTTSSNVAEFATEHITDALRSAGLRLADGGQADYILSGDIRTFFVTETDEYRGEFVVLFKVRTAAGKEIFRGVVNGAGANFGRSYKAENYYQTISDMILQESHNLLTNSELQRAFEAPASTAARAP